jgi:ABC-type uncharacterized transport system permease subunit
MRDNEILIGTFVLNFVITYLSRSFVHGRRDKDVYGQQTRQPKKEKKKTNYARNNVK